MWTRLSQIGLFFIIMSLPLLTKKEDDPGQRKSATQILEEAILAKEQEELRDSLVNHSDKQDDSNKLARSQIE